MDPIDRKRPQDGSFDDSQMKRFRPEDQTGYYPPAAAAPQQGGYQYPPTQQTAIPPQSGYQTAPPQPQGSYQYPPTQQAVVTPPQQQGGYQYPPTQQTTVAPTQQQAPVQQQGGYQYPPTQQTTAPQPQSSYQYPPSTQQGGYQAPPQVPPTQQHPPSQVPPSTQQQGGYQAPAQLGGYQYPPSTQGGYQQAPSQPTYQDQQAPPQNTGYYQQQAPTANQQGYQYPPTNQQGYQALPPPQQQGYQYPPTNQQGGYYAPPPQGGYYAPPPPQSYGYDAYGYPYPPPPPQQQSGYYAPQQPQNPYGYQYPPPQQQPSQNPYGYQYPPPPQLDAYGQPIQIPPVQQPPIQQQQTYPPQPTQQQPIQPVQQPIPQQQTYPPQPTQQQPISQPVQQPIQQQQTYPPQPTQQQPIPQPVQQPIPQPQQPIQQQQQTYPPQPIQQQQQSIPQPTQQQQETPAIISDWQKSVSSVNAINQERIRDRVIVVDDNLSPPRSTGDRESMKRRLDNRDSIGIRDTRDTKRNDYGNGRDSYDLVRDNYGSGRDSYDLVRDSYGSGNRDSRDRIPTSTTTTSSTSTTPLDLSSGSIPPPSSLNEPTGPLGGGIGFVKRVRDEDVTNINDGSKQLGLTKTRNHSGQVKLATNQFLLNIDKSIKIWQYSVSFIPIIYNRAKKYDIIASLVNAIGFNIYDGSGSLYCLKENSEEQVHQYQDITVRVQLIKALDPSSTIQFYNIFMKKVMKLLGFSIVGRQYYNSNLSERIESSSLNVWPGFFTSINKISSGVALLADLSRKVIRKESVLSVIRDKRYSRTEVERELIGSIVITLYNNKTYRINSIEWSKSPKTTFSTDNGDISFEKYYKITYDRSVTDMDQPLLISRCKGRKEDVFLIPEFCNLTGIPDEDRKNFNKMKDINDRTVIEPRKRFHGLSEFISSINSSTEIKEEARRWGISFQSSLEVTANCFNEPVKDNQQMDKLKSIWAIIACDNNNREIDQFEREMGKYCLEHPTIRTVRGGGRDFAHAIKDIVNDKNPDFIVCIIPSVQTEIYNAIKRTAILDCKVITQVITARTIADRKFVKVLPKIMLQINTKIGKAPWRLSHPVQGIPKDVMIVGIDVGHNTQKDARSVAAFCATTNASFTNVYVSATIQKQSTKEVINSLGASMGNALKAYHKINSRLPETVIVYRDGVSDGMIDQVNKFEVQCIRESFTMLPSSMGAKPKLIYIIVKKNTHLRFFDLGGNYSNPNQGVVISQGVTKERWYDFFLISQKTTKGTANPTHYHIIQDETNIPPEALQQLTYNLCFLYFNFDQSVSVPSVCQFSHKAALLVGKSCNANTPEELSNRLFFL